MKRFIAILLVLCSFATPIYASADDSDYAPMDSTAELLASNDDGCMTEDDQSNYNFWIEHTLAAGETVYLKVGAYEDNSFEDYYYLYLFKVG